MNKTSPVWAFISAANPFSGRFQVFNFQYEPRRARGRFLARFTYLNRISIQGNELELASFPNFAATLTVFTKTAHVKEGIHTPSSLKKKFFVFHAGVRYIADLFREDSKCSISSTKIHRGVVDFSLASLTSIEFQQKETSWS